MMAVPCPTCGHVELTYEELVDVVYQAASRSVLDDERQPPDEDE